jgi:hypothetical protein
MSLIIRTWGCQNQACLSRFESGERAPACPACGCVRVGWVPGKVNVGSASTRQMDATLRDLCAAYGLTDINSPSPSRQPQAKILAKPTAAGGKMNFQGFAAEVNPSAGAQCVPVDNVTAKVKPGIGQALTGQLGMGSLGSNTEIVATHRGNR